MCDYYPVAARLGDEQRQATTQTAELLRSLGHTVAEQEVGFPQSMSTNYMIRYLAGTAENLAAVDQPDQVSKRTRTMASLGQRIPDKVVQKALAGEAKMADKVNQIFDDFDLVLTPGAVEDPLTIGQLDGKDAFRTLYASGRKIPNFAPWNSIGQPAVSIPAGFSSRGLPLAVQLAGPANEEATLLAVAAQLEAARPWADQRPEL